MKNFLLITEHPIERVTRVLIGIGLISIVFVGPKTGWGWLGLLPLITGFTGLCPLYTVLGISTLGKKATPVPAGRTLHQGLGLARLPTGLFDHARLGDVEGLRLGD